MALHLTPENEIVSPNIPPNQLYRQTLPVVKKDGLTLTPAAGMPVQQDTGPADFGTELLKGIPSMFLRAGEGVLGVAEMAIPGDYLEGAIENVQSFRERMFPMAEGGWGWAGRVVGEAIPFLAMSVASFGATGSMLGPFMTAFTVEGGGAYNEAKSAGASEWKAKTEGTLVGTLNGLLEMWGINKLLKFSGVGKGSAKALVRSVKGKLWKEAKGELSKITSSMIQSAMSEGIQEMSQEGVSLAVPALVSDRFPRNPDGSTNWNSVLKHIGTAGLAGALVGGAFTGARAAIAAGPEAAMPTQTELTKYKDTINSSKLPYKKKQFLIKEIDSKFGEKAEVMIPGPETPVEGQTPVEGIRDTTPVLNEYDSVVKELNTQLDKIEELRPEEEEAISKERGKRFNEFRNILGQVDNPTAAAFIARSALAGEMKVKFSPISEIMSPEKMNVLFEKARQLPLTEVEYLHTTEGMKKLFFDGKIPARHEVDALSNIFPKETIHKLVELRKRLGQDKFNLLLETLNVPRSILASFDVSAPLRQGLLLFFRNPKIWAKTVFHGYRAFASDKYAEFMDMQIRTHPQFKRLKKSGLILTKVGGLESGEEVFRGDLAAKIPGIGKGILASERAYVTTLNLLRAHNFYHVVEQWEGKGHSQEDYKQLASYLNHATGRGDIKALGKIMPALSAVFFAPRLQIGRVQVLTDLYTKPAIRKMAAMDLVKFASTAIGLLALLSLKKGVEVEKDPRSSDFGKVRFGNTRIDFLGGYQQLIRYTAQLISGKSKGITSGRIMQTDRGQIMWRFLQSKMSPVAMLTTDAIRGETFLGKPLRADAETISRELHERLLPLFIQDVIDAGVHQGWGAAGIVTPLAMHGVGAQTYPATSGSESAKTKDAYAMDFLNKKWDELGPDIQNMLREYRPQISLMEQKARMDRENTSFLSRMIKEQDRVSKRIHRSLPRGIRNEMDRLLVRIPGLSRHVGSDWYLNERRYKAYEDKTTTLLNQILPKMMNTSFWNSLPDQVRAQIITETVDTIKKQVRNDIMIKATLRDLQEMR